MHYFFLSCSDNIFKKHESVKAVSTPANKIYLKTVTSHCHRMTYSNIQNISARILVVFKWPLIYQVFLPFMSRS